MAREKKVRVTVTVDELELMLLAMHQLHVETEKIPGEANKLRRYLTAVYARENPQGYQRRVRDGFLEPI